MSILPCLMFCVSLAFANWLNPTGWLDRLVQYHKQKFLENVNEVAPIMIKATIATAPPGYQDSTDWEFESVMRLITLMRKSPQAKPAVRALRRMLGPGTRRFMSRGASYKYFPSLFKDTNIDIYYDVDSDEYLDEKETTQTATSVLTDDAVIYISNPVESRLPSAQISVGLLKQILEKRAEAARVMPTTPHWTVKTKPKANATTSGATTAAANGGATTAAGDAPAVDNAGSNSTNSTA